MERRRYTSDDLTVLPWPRPRSAEGPAVTEWVLEAVEEVGTADLDLIVSRLRLSDPDLAITATRTNPRTVILAFSWPTYNGEALSRSAQAIRLITEVLDVERVQGVDKKQWPFLRQ
jgi:hypothetical protein